MVQSDTTAPIVTARPERAPNVAGWYNAPVTVTWTATDPPPSSGAPTTPPPTAADTYRLADAQWLFNWNTGKNQAGSYWQVGVQLDDGTVHYVVVALR